MSRRKAYDPSARLGGPNTIHHRIVTYRPERLLVLRNISTPPRLPGAAVYPEITQVVELTPTPAGARVTLSGSGYRQGADYDRLYAFFAAGNSEYLKELKDLVERMPQPAMLAPSGGRN